MGIQLNSSWGVIVLEVVLKRLVVQTVIVLAGVFLPASYAQNNLEKVQPIPRIPLSVSPNPGAEPGNILFSITVHIINNTDHPVVFLIPELGIAYFVAENIQPTFNINVSPMTTQRITYQVVDAIGKQLAYGDVYNPASPIRSADRLIIVNDALSLPHRRISVRSTGKKRYKGRVATEQNNSYGNSASGGAAPPYSYGFSAGESSARPYSYNTSYTVSTEESPSSSSAAAPFSPAASVSPPVSPSSPTSHPIPTPARKPEASFSKKPAETAVTTHPLPASPQTAVENPVTIPKSSQPLPEQETTSPDEGLNSAILRQTFRGWGNLDAPKDLKVGESGYVTATLGVNPLGVQNALERMTHHTGIGQSEVTLSDRMTARLEGPNFDIQPKAMLEMAVSRLKENTAIFQWQVTPKKAGWQHLHVTFYNQIWVKDHYDSQLIPPALDRDIDVHVTMPYLFDQMLGVLDRFKVLLGALAALLAGAWGLRSQWRRLVSNSAPLPLTTQDETEQVSRERKPYAAPISSNKEKTAPPDEETIPTAETDESSQITHS